jgi:DNA repair photolyase
MEVYVKGRGAQKNPSNRFLKAATEIYTDDLATDEERRDLLGENFRTKYIEVFPKTILNKVDSPDLGLSWSMNPYQGCEHGCIYCYARNTHEYWGYSAGKEFEQNILVKKKAPDLLRQIFESKKWQAEPIVLSGNTDCYQPAERRFGITRKLLAVFLEYKHPISIITKNSLIERDIDLLEKLAAENLVALTLSLTTLNEKLKRIIEPRTSSVNSVLLTISKLSATGIPVSVNMAPVIPAINNEEIFKLLETVSAAGACTANYIVVRLNGHNGLLFEDWIRKNFPERANKVLNQIKAMHGGNLNDTNYSRRMKGEGNFATLIRQQFLLARNKFFGHKKMPVLNFDLFEQQREKIIQARETQMKLF